MEQLKNNKKILRVIVERLFTFAELDSYYDGVDSNTGNIYCKFHPAEGYSENLRSPASKMFYNDEKDIQELHCWTSRRNYSVYDYVTMVMEEDPYEYLIKNKNKEEILPLYEALQKGYINIDSALLEKKIEYLNNTYIECEEDVSDYIEKVYSLGG